MYVYIFVYNNFQTQIEARFPKHLSHILSRFENLCSVKDVNKKHTKSWQTTKLSVIAILMNCRTTDYNDMLYRKIS